MCDLHCRCALGSEFSDLCLAAHFLQIGYKFTTSVQVFHGLLCVHHFFCIVGSVLGRLLASFAEGKEGFLGCDCLLLRWLSAGGLGGRRMAPTVGNETETRSEEEVSQNGAAAEQRPVKELKVVFVLGMLAFRVSSPGFECGIQCSALASIKLVCDLLQSESCSTRRTDRFLN